MGRGRPSPIRVGQKFNRLTALEKVGRDGRSYALWRCACECGGEKVVASNLLSAGNTKSCGCLGHKGEHRTVSPGYHSGRLTAVQRLPDGRWLCECECGNKPVVHNGSLQSGNTRSCGCLTNRAPENKHDGRGTGAWNSWKDMNKRCSNPRCERFPHYGGRGITVCLRWKAFVNFLADMGPRPEGTSLDRIDVNGNYEPGNCRWATAQVQMRNRTDNRFVEYGGSRFTIAAWSDITGIVQRKIARRLDDGWSPSEALGFQERISLPRSRMKYTIRAHPKRSRPY